MFIAGDNPVHADAFIDLIDAKVQHLSRQPGLGRRREDLVAGLRSFPVGRYAIFYLQEQDRLMIVRVLHGARDVDSIFPEPEEEIQP